MSGLMLTVVLVLGVILLTPVADKVRVPQPVLLTIFGLALALASPSTTFSLDPALILPLVLPPLLFAATQRTTVNEFREHASAVFVLAVGLTVATVAVVAVVAHAAGLPWTVAWVLGAMVSPPDPVAATAVARRLRLPHRLVTILEGEGMFNDATALVAYKVAIIAAVTGDITAVDVGLELVEALVLGVAIGLALGYVTRLLLARIHDGYAETTLTVLVPFGAYVGAEHVNGSGVLAVLVLGLYLRTFGHEATTSGGWLLGRAVWSYADFLITSLVFALLGFELVSVIRSTAVTMQTVWLALLVVATLVVFRAAWIFPAASLGRFRARRRDRPVPSNWRESAVVSWAGMRGVVTVATALALPTVVETGGPLPNRNEIVAVALACVLLTLVVQGLTLGPLTRLLGVGSDADEAKEVSALRLRATEAALAQIREEVGASGTDDDVQQAAMAQYEGYLAAQQRMDQAREGGGSEQTEQPGRALESLLSRASDVERQLVLRERRRGEVSAGAADEVLRDIENRALRDFS
ncbi:Na+/H+ antiporter [Humibacillus sp. DSM 29435]|uniref:Na+/H+ antiporter n=1 Tax=Humibacillus sp. DSM 29435 TaxID=1869167 RepID=UPI0011131021|nr:Na+/H+ antiporter [Humibacillus sp. DSM 29435]